MKIYIDIIKKLYQGNDDLNKILLDVMNLEHSGIIKWQSSFNQENFGTYFVKKCFETDRVKELIKNNKLRDCCVEKLAKLDNKKSLMFISKMITEYKADFNPNFIKMMNELKESNIMYITKVAKFTSSSDYFENEGFPSLLFDLGFFIDYSNQDYFIKYIFDGNEINRKIANTSIDLKNEPGLKKGFLQFFKESAIEPMDLDLIYNDTFEHWVASDSHFNPNLVKEKNEKEMDDISNAIGLTPIDYALSVNNKFFIDMYFAQTTSSFVNLNFENYNKSDVIKKCVLDYTSYTDKDFHWWVPYLEKSNFIDKETHRLLLPWFFLDAQGSRNKKEDKEIKKKIVNDFYDVLNIIQKRNPDFILKKNNQGENLLHQLAIFARDKKSLIGIGDFFIYLIKSGLDVNAKDNKGQSPLFYFTALNMNLVSELINNYNLDLTVVNNKGENLFEATKLKKTSKYHKFLEYNFLKNKTELSSKTKIKRKML